MLSRDPLGRRGRLLAVAVLLVALLTLLVWHGTLAHDPARHDYPDEDAVVPEPEAYVGERVVLGGDVVATDPVTVAVASDAGRDAERTIVVENADAALRNTDGPIETGDELTVFGTLEAADTVAAERSIARADWERWYMYAVSALGGLWVLGRLVRGWRFDRDRLALVPRERSLAASDRDGAPLDRAERSRDREPRARDEDATTGGDSS